MTHVCPFCTKRFTPCYLYNILLLFVLVLQSSKINQVIERYVIVLPFKSAYSINVCTFVHLATYAKPSISFFCHLFLKLLGGTLSYNFQQISNRLVLKILAHLLRKIRKISEIGRYNI